MTYINIPHNNLANTLYPALSVDNDYVPIHSLSDGEIIRSDKGHKAFLYYLQVPDEDSLHTRNRFSIFCDNLSPEFTYVPNYWMTIEEHYTGHYGTVIYHDFYKNEI